MTGVSTTLPFFRWLVREPAFAAADFSTTYLDGVLADRRESFVVPTATDERDAAIAAALAAWFRAQRCRRCRSCRFRIGVAPGRPCRVAPMIFEVEINGVTWAVSVDAIGASAQSGGRFRVASRRAATAEASDAPVCDDAGGRRPPDGSRTVDCHHRWPPRRRCGGDGSPRWRLLRPVAACGRDGVGRWPALSTRGWRRRDG